MFYKFYCKLSVKTRKVCILRKMSRSIIWEANEIVLFNVIYHKSLTSPFLPMAKTFSAAKKGEKARANVIKFQPS